MIEGQRDKLKPCVGVMILKEGKVLLGKRKGSHGHGEYSIPGGHLEFQESFKECAERETLEEVGVKIENIKYLCTANYCRHENRQDILIGISADWKDHEPETYENEKIGEWDWYGLDDLPSPLFYPSELIINSYKTGKNFYDKE
jgi:8-oxo-dGTP diphosphatase